LSSAAAKSASPSSHSSFAKKFFRSPSRTGGFRNRFAAITEPKSFKTGSSVTLANEVERSNILAPGLPFRHPPDAPSSRLHPRMFSGLPWESYPVQQRNCSRFARDSFAPITFSSSQRTGSRITPLPCELKTNLVSRAIIAAVTASNSSSASRYRQRRLIGSNLTLALAGKISGSAPHG